MEQQPKSEPTTNEVYRKNLADKLREKRALETDLPERTGDDSLRPSEELLDGKDGKGQRETIFYKEAQAEHRKKQLEVRKASAMRRYSLAKSQLERFGVTPEDNDSQENAVEKTEKQELAVVALDNQSATVVKRIEENTSEKEVEKLSESEEGFVAVIEEETEKAENSIVEKAKTKITESVASIKKTLVWLKGKNNLFSTNSMIFREESKLRALEDTSKKTAEAETAVVAVAALEDSSETLEQKTAAAALHVVSERGEKLKSKAEKNKKKGNLLSRNWKKIAGAAAFGALLFSLNTCESKDGRTTGKAATKIETVAGKAATKIETVAGKAATKIETVAGKAATKMERTATKVERGSSVEQVVDIESSDGITQLIERAMQNNESLRAAAGQTLETMTPEYFKQVGESINVIDTNGNEVRLGSEAIGGQALVKYSQDKGFVVVMDFDKSNHEINDIMSADREDGFHAAVEGEYVSTNDGTFIEKGKVSLESQLTEAENNARLLFQEMNKFGRDGNVKGKEATKINWEKAKKEVQKIEKAIKSDTSAGKTANYTDYLINK